MDEREGRVVAGAGVRESTNLLPGLKEDGTPIHILSVRFSHSLCSRLRAKDSLITHPPQFWLEESVELLSFYLLVTRENEEEKGVTILGAYS